MLGLVMFGALVIPAGAAEVRRDTSGHTHWTEAVKLGRLNKEFVLFGRLGPSGDHRWYVFSATSGQQVRLMLTVPVDSEPRFRPKLAIYQPDTVTAGPLLPMEQPPETVALVYDARQNQRQHESLTQTEYLTRLGVVADFPVGGRYYLSVFNVATVGGSYRLTLGQDRGLTLATIISYPQRWWYSQAWAGFNPQSIFLPAVSLGVLGLAIWFKIMTTRTRVHVPRSKRPPAR